MRIITFSTLALGIAAIALGGIDQEENFAQIDTYNVDVGGLPGKED